MLAVWAKWAHVSRRVMYQTMPDHFILAFESLSTLASRAALDRAVMRASRRVNVGVRIQQVLRLKRMGIAAVESANI